MANNAFGIDLGTNNIKIYNRNDDNIMIEKNMIAIENKNVLRYNRDYKFMDARYAHYSLQMIVRKLYRLVIFLIHFPTE